MKRAHYANIPPFGCKKIHAKLHLYPHVTVYPITVQKSWASYQCVILDGVGSS